MRRALLLLCSLLLWAGPCLTFAQKPKDLVIWGMALDPDDKGQDAMIREFQRLHPEYNVRVLSMGAGKMDPQKLMTSIVGNVAPDVINQDRFTISDWASRGAFLDLDPLMQRDAKDPLCPRAADYYHSAWEEATYGGKVYGIPAAADNRALYWNRDLFRKHAKELKDAGLDPDRAPRTWSELLAYQKILTEYNPDGSIKVAGFIPIFGNSWLYIYAFANNAEFLSPDGRRCTMTSKPVEEALSFVVKGYDNIGGFDIAKRFESGALQRDNDPFIQGRVAMKIDGNWILNDIARFAPHLDFSVSPPPSPDDRVNHVGRFKDEKDTYVTWTGGFAYAIPRGARNVEGGWEFIKFVSSRDGRRIDQDEERKWQLGRGRMFIPIQQANRLANEEIFKSFAPADPKFAAAVKVHVDLMRVGRTRPVTFAGQLMWDENQRAVENACMHKMSPHDALMLAQTRVQAELDAFFSHESHPLVPNWLPLASILGIMAILIAAPLIAYRRIKLQKLARHEARWAYFMISPWVIGFVVFTLGPMLASLFLSFTEYNQLTDARWVGVQNYTAMATTDHVNVWKAFSNAFYLAGIGVPLGIFTGLAIAMLLNARVRGLRWYRTIFYLPAIIPVIPSALLWEWVLASDPNRGLVNAVWVGTISKWLSLPPPGWLRSEAWSKPALIAMGLWGAGSGMILWLAGLKGIPRSLYEASEIDGASPKQQFFSITLPQLSPFIFFNVVMGFIYALQEFDRVYVMKPNEESVGPGDSMLVPVYYLFRNGFGYFKMGYASALAWLIFAIILVLTVVQFKLAPRWVHYEVEK